MTSDTRASPNFYTLSFGSLPERINAAQQVEGLEHEVALIRGRLSEFVYARSEDVDTLLKFARVIIRAVAEHYRLRPKDERALEARVLASVRELTAQFRPPEDDDV